MFDKQAKKSQTIDKEKSQTIDRQTLEKFKDKFNDPQMPFNQEKKEVVELLNLVDMEEIEKEINNILKHISQIDGLLGSTTAYLSDYRVKQSYSASLGIEDAFSTPQLKELNALGAMLGIQLEYEDGSAKFKEDYKTMQEI